VFLQCPVKNLRSGTRFHRNTGEVWAVVRATFTHPEGLPTEAALQKQQGDDDHDTTHDTRDRRRCKSEKLSVVDHLRWRSQFASEPASHCSGFHRVGYALMNVIASRALECSDVKARGRG
jgi:hypothetical protein